MHNKAQKSRRGTAVGKYLKEATYIPFKAGIGFSKTAEIRLSVSDIWIIIMKILSSSNSIDTFLYTFIHVKSSQNMVHK